MRVYRCRSCGHENDFDAAESELNERLAAAGEVLMFTEYRCEGCGFGVKVEPFWFLTERGENPMFIETGFEVVVA